MTYNQREKLKVFSITCIAIGLITWTCYLIITTPAQPRSTKQPQQKGCGCQSKFLIYFYKNKKNGYNIGNNWIFYVVVVC